MNCVFLIVASFVVLVTAQPLSTGNSGAQIPVLPCLPLPQQIVCLKLLGIGVGVNVTLPTGPTAINCSPPTGPLPVQLPMPVNSLLSNIPNPLPIVQNLLSQQLLQCGIQQPLSGVALPSVHTPSVGLPSVTTPSVGASAGGNVNASAGGSVGSQ